jgi:ribosome production factor 1
MKEFCKCIPNSEVRQRKGRDLKKIIPQAIARGFTAMVIVNEDKSKPSILEIISLKKLAIYTSKQFDSVQGLLGF